jgi:uncharacterized protein
MSEFVGRLSELQLLNKEFTRVRQAARSGEPGRCLLMRGRRRVGKSRLIERFVESVGMPSVFFTASRQGVREVDAFADELVASTVPAAASFSGVEFKSWDAVLRELARAIGDQPTVVVIDEFPYLVEDDPTIEAVFQKMWDRHLSKVPVLLVLIGSDLAMMEALNSHGRAFFQRGKEFVVHPLSPVETAHVTGTIDAAAAFDAYLITGGLPLIAGEWTTGLDMWAYLDEALRDPTSALIVSGERSLAAEFPAEAQARAVLSQIGAGERTFSTIARAGGGMTATSTSRSLALLIGKRLVAKDVPLSTKPSRESRYRVTDPYLRFWLTFVGPYIAEIERGRGDRVVERIRASWESWRGRAIEPVVREAVLRLQPIRGVPSADEVGGYWTRTNTPEVDIIGADRAPVAQRVMFAGSVKWRMNAPFDQSDLHELTGKLGAVPGCSTKTALIVVSRSGSTAKGVAATLGPEELLAAW